MESKQAATGLDASLSVLDKKLSEIKYSIDEINDVTSSIIGRLQPITIPSTPEDGTVPVEEKPASSRIIEELNTVILRLQAHRRTLSSFKDRIDI